MKNTTKGGYLLKINKKQTVNYFGVNLDAVKDYERRCVRCNNILTKENDYCEDLKLYHAYCKSCRSEKKGGN